MNILDQHSTEITQLCLRFQVKSLFAFGSAITDKFKDESDVDLIVEFSPTIPLMDYADNYFELRFALQDLFQRPVDLLEQQAIKNPYFLQVVEKKRLVVYEA